MTVVEKIIEDVKIRLKSSAPITTKEQKNRMYNIINSDNPNFEKYGLKMTEIENIIKSIYNKYEKSYDNATEIFKSLMSSNIQEEKFAGVFYINKFKKYFNKETIKLFHDVFLAYCDSWSICDSTMIRVMGPFLAKKTNKELYEKIIEDWSNSENMWIRRASMVILLKIIMMKKEFDNDYVFALIKKMLQHSEDYIQKGIGWLLKTCSNYKPDIIYDYLENNRNYLPRLILRYASEKLSKDKRKKLLKK